jgi:hypothetical protein
MNKDDMTVFEIVVPCSDCGEIFMCDAINYRNGVWLVPHWTNNRLGLLRGKAAVFGDLAVPVMTISKALLEGHAQPSPPVELIESPAISFPIPGMDRNH